jgi:hypothetical protein
MAKVSLRSASIYCLVVWVAIWLLFLLMRFSVLNITGIPGVGMVLLGALVVALLAPIMAMGLAVVGLVRQPKVSLNWIVFGCATAALFGQVLLFLITKWM